MKKLFKRFIYVLYVTEDSMLKTRSLSSLSSSEKIKKKVSQRNTLDHFFIFTHVDLMEVIEINMQKLNSNYSH
jgi:hypothetical protein